MTDAREDRPRRAPERVRRFLELFAACGLALAQPILDVFGRAPDQFAYRGASSRDIVLFGVGVLVAPPLALWVIETAVDLVSRSAARVLHLVILGGLVAVLAVQLLQSVDRAAVAVLLSVVVGVAFAVLYLRTEAARLWLSFLAVAPLLFLASFLTMSETASLFESTDPYSVEPSSPSSVVMVVFDELPLVTLMRSDGTIDGDLFPAFAALSEGSHWFRQTTSVSSMTAMAVPALLTGVLPTGEGSALAADHPDNLFTLLGGSYGLDVRETVTRLCPTNLCDPATPDGSALRALAADARTVLASRVRPTQEQVELTAELGAALSDEKSEEERLIEAYTTDQTDRFEGAVDAMADGATTLHYLHLLLPHVPWHHLPDGQAYRGIAPGYGRKEGVWISPHLADVEHQRHVLQARYADALLGQLVQTLRDKGLYDEITLVVAADHGISFAPDHASRGTAADGQQPLDVASQLMYVPFFLKEPGQSSPEVVDGNVWTIDVVPTLADVLDLEIPWDVDGRSALGSHRPEGPTSFYLNDPDGEGSRLGLLQEADSGALWAAALQETIDRSFPPGAGVDPWRIWRGGPRPDLSGQPLDGVTPMAVRFDPALTLDLANGGRDAAAPVFIRGYLQAPPATDVAIVVNGIVATTATTMDDGSFAAMVNPVLYRVGSNELLVVPVPNT